MSLKKKSTRELALIAKNLQIKGFSSKSRKQLIVAIQKAREGTELDDYGHAEGSLGWRKQRQFYREERHKEQARKQPARIPR
jgi:hypothetical protein